MKKLILSLAVFTLTATTVLAQDAEGNGKGKGHGKGGVKGENMKNKTPEERAKHGANWAEKKLTLTPDQKTKWEAAALERITANAPLRDKLKGSTTPEERKATRTQIKANQDKFNTTVDGFLTPEQKTKWDAEKKQRKEKVKGNAKAKADEVEIEAED